MVRGLVMTGLAVAATPLVAGLAGCASSPTGTSAAGSAHFVGFRWRITTIAHSGSPVRIPAALGGFVAFDRDHTLRADDSVNAYFGQYHVGSGGSYRPLNVGSTLVGWVGRDRARLSLIHGVEALTQSNAVVTADVDGDRLRLSTADYLITCSKLGIAPSEPAPSPTATPP